MGLGRGRKSDLPGPDSRGTVHPAGWAFANLIITGPLLLGLAFFFLALSRKQEAALSQIFDGLQRFVDALSPFF